MLALPPVAAQPTTNNIVIKASKILFILILPDTLLKLVNVKTDAVIQSLAHQWVVAQDHQQVQFLEVRHLQMRLAIG